MPRDDTIIFGDPVGKLDVLEFAGDRCGRKGRYAAAVEARQAGQRGSGQRAPVEIRRF
jgi:hypothetical protein